MCTRTRGLSGGWGEPRARGGWRAEPLRAALDDLGRRLGLDASGSRDAVKDGKSPVAALTPREREVLRLMSRGLSNRQIGEELFISQKTASVHVSNILAKLGAATRTEAAAIARAEDI